MSDPFELFSIPQPLRDEFPPIREEVSHLMGIADWGQRVEEDLMRSPGLRAIMEGHKARARAACDKLIAIELHADSFTSEARRCIGEIQDYARAVEYLVEAIETGRQAARKIRSEELR